jgi:hypothetical protein
VLTPPATATDEDDGLLTASEAAKLSLDADIVLLSPATRRRRTARPGRGGSRAGQVVHLRREPVAARLALVRRHRRRGGAHDGHVRGLAREPGMGRAEALRRSMLAVMASGARPYFSHPAAWAPFVVVGEGGAARAAVVTDAAAPGG